MDAAQATLSPVSDSSVVLPDSTTTLVVDMATNNEEESTISSLFSNQTSPTIHRPSSTSVSILLVAKQTPKQKEHAAIAKVPAKKHLSSPRSPVRNKANPEASMNRYLSFFLLFTFSSSCNKQSIHFCVLILVESRRHRI